MRKTGQGKIYYPYKERHELLKKTREKTSQVKAMAVTVPDNEVVLWKKHCEGLRKKIKWRKLIYQWHRGGGKT